MSSTNTQNLVISGDVMSSDIAFDTSSDGNLMSGQFQSDGQNMNINNNQVADAEMSYIVDIEDN